MAAEAGSTFENEEKRSIGDGTKRRDEKTMLGGWKGKREKGGRENKREEERRESGRPGICMRIDDLYQPRAPCETKQADGRVFAGETCFRPTTLHESHA
jgi:hypothetical protein